MRLYPLICSPAYHQRVWGGRNLETILGKQLPHQGTIGESWEIYDTNTIINGEYSGYTLKELLTKFPNELGGNLYTDGDFPLLIKFLDAQDWLSVQVHPNDELAQVLEGQPRGKTECWYVIEAAPDAEIIYGFSQTITAEEFRDTVTNGGTKNVLNFVKVRKGDFIFVPAGTVHALGKGVVIYELQQTSDTTYRLYDWDRVGLDGKPRELHIEKGIICSNFFLINPPLNPGTTIRHHNAFTEELLTDNEYFTLKKYYNFKETYKILLQGDSAQILTVLHGALQLSGEFDDIHVQQGMSIILPAKLPYCDVKASIDCEILVAQYNS